jgi:hypothetical protein
MEAGHHTRFLLKPAGAAMENLYRPGTTVNARWREWIVLPSREPEVLRLRPLTSAQADEIGLYLPLEQDRVQPARFNDLHPVSGGDATDNDAI